MGRWCSAARAADAARVRHGQRRSSPRRSIESNRLFSTGQAVFLALESAVFVEVWRAGWHARDLARLLPQVPPRTPRPVHAPSPVLRPPSPVPRLPSKCCALAESVDALRAACGVRRAACGVRRAACGVRRAACGVWRAVVCGGGWRGGARCACVDGWGSLAGANIERGGARCACVDGCAAPYIGDDPSHH
jgi:hypothetical protein